MVRHRVALAIHALLLRFWHLGGKSLWLDEAYSFSRASLPVSEIWSMTSDPHPPGYYLVLHTALLFGNSETILRAPSATASVLSVGLVAGSYITEDVRRFVELPALRSSSYLFLLAALAVFTIGACAALAAAPRPFPQATAAMCVSVLIAATVLVPIPRAYTLKKLLVTGCWSCCSRPGSSIGPRRGEPDWLDWQWPRHSSPLS